MKYMLVLLLLCPVLVHAQDAAGREVALLTGMQGKVTLRSGGQESSPCSDTVSLEVMSCAYSVVTPRWSFFQENWLR